MKAGAVVGGIIDINGQREQLLAWCRHVRYWLEWSRRERRIIDIGFGYPFWRCLQRCDAFFLLFVPPRIHGFVLCFPLPTVTANALAQLCQFSTPPFSLPLESFPKVTDLPLFGILQSLLLLNRPDTTPLLPLNFFLLPLVFLNNSFFLSALPSSSKTASFVLWVQILL